MERLSPSHNTIATFNIPLGEYSIHVTHLNLFLWIFWLLFIPAFIVGRAYNLTGMPVFVDEATHIVWANRIMNTGQIMGFTDAGKTVHPLILAIIFGIKGLDQLWLARAFSILTGLLAALGCYWLGKSLNNDRRVGVLACLVYSLSPFTLFHDRIALADSLLTALGIFVLIFAIKTVRSPRYRYAVILGIVMGLAALTKLYGVIYIAIPLAAWVMLEKRATLQRIWRVGAVAYLTSLIVVSPNFLVAGALVGYMRGKTVKPWEPVSMADLWQTNVGLAFTWLTTYLTPIVLILAILGLILAFYYKNRSEMLVGAVSVLGVLFFIAVSQRWYPRYLLITAPGFYLLAAVAIIRISDGLEAKMATAMSRPNLFRFAIPVLLGLLVVVQSLSFDYRMVTDLRTAPLVEVDRWQFVEGWPAGYGLPEIVDYLTKEASQQGGIVIVRHEELRVFLEGLEVYLYDEPDIELRTINFYEAGSLTQLQEISEQLPTYVAVEAPIEGLPDLTQVPGLDLAMRFEKSGGISAIEIYGPSK